VWFFVQRHLALAPPLVDPLTILDELFFLVAVCNFCPPFFLFFLARAPTLFFKTALVFFCFVNIFSLPVSELFSLVGFCLLRFSLHLAGRSGLLSFVFGYVLSPFFRSLSRPLLRPATLRRRLSRVRLCVLVQSSWRASTVVSYLANISTRVV